MLTKKEFADGIYNVLTPADLYDKMSKVLTQEKCPGVFINYGKGHFVIAHERFSDGLSISTDGLGVWVITGLESTPDGSYQYTDKVLKTENTETVSRAIAALIINWEESEPPSS
ncbi:MAG: hypothetical protein GYA23_02200 [Methanomicrobiales archaeon]|nr:hypothetical protein [Methanomicrobiales archaeon]